jgi:hypothetical protein
MAYKIMHRSREQEIRFPTQAAAERYAEQLAGGIGNWTVVEAGQVPHPAEQPDPEVR